MSENGRYWLLTIPHEAFTPYLPPGVAYIRGQLEQGGNTGYTHWQVLVVFGKNVRLSFVRKTFGPYHAELAKSQRAREYVWKEDTRIEGTQFELGTLPIRVNSKTDWTRVWELAATGKYMEIPERIRFTHYRNIKSIQKDHEKPIAFEKKVYVFWGKTGTGKSRRAWEEAGPDAYPKDPNTKYWDGYSGEKNVVIDEFRGIINISNMLRWLDRYPVRVENKHGAACLRCEEIWITSNIPPQEWYPQLDLATQDALIRRFEKIEEFK